MVLAIVLVSIEGVALAREISNCDPLVNACVPLCFLASNNLVFLGLFEVAFCFTAAVIATRITRRMSQVEPLQSAVEPLPRWATPSLYALESKYMDDYLARRMHRRTSPARRYDSSTQTHRPRFDDDRYTFP
ncbi:hypothetical protein HOLleu_39935 [Holothuria leucospilota]|uniref:Uncharacterized protein n=1 Tax=Holothuria leucospilota TaxID=206669 RepID=A0A9Q0YCM1_HOLLE|nr:hypothetical protein HOLleu_39935 [Holothuria leucospilota]